MRQIWLPLCVALGITGCVRLDDTPMRLVNGTLQPVVTWKTAMERNIVMQRYDYSCGAAAMATLMNHYFGDSVDERDILRDILAKLNTVDSADRKEEGLSLLDLQQFAARRGYQAVGVRLTPEALPQLKGPILVYLETPEYRHFAILRGVREDRVFLADPARGNVRQPMDRFVLEWPGIALVLGKPGFGTPENHDLAIDIDVVRPELVAARRALFL
jgi:uncharacterized protein